MRVVEKRKPHYRLVEIKAVFADPATMNRSFSSRLGADALRLDDAAGVALIQSLAAADFEKSMTSYANHKIWQDVYRCHSGSTKIYVKFTLDAVGSLFLISFKEA